MTYSHAAFANRLFQGVGVPAQQQHTATKINSKNNNKINTPKNKPDHFVTTEDDLLVEAESISYVRSPFSRFVEAFFTLSIIFSTAMFPFAFANMFLPEFMASFVVFPFSLILIPYAIVMIIVGIKIAGMFGCSLWDRLTKGVEDDAVSND